MDYQRFSELILDCNNSTCDAAWQWLLTCAHVETADLLIHLKCRRSRQETSFSTYSGRSTTAAGLPPFPRPFLVASLSAWPDLRFFGTWLMPGSYLQGRTSAMPKQLSQKQAKCLESSVSDIRNIIWQGTDAGALLLLSLQRLPQESFASCCCYRDRQHA